MSRPPRMVWVVLEGGPYRDGPGQLHHVMPDEDHVELGMGTDPEGYHHVGPLAAWRWHRWEATERTQEVKPYHDVSTARVFTYTGSRPYSAVEDPTVAARYLGGELGMRRMDPDELKQHLPDPEGGPRRDDPEPPHP